jgi:hypothetical protein
MLAAVQTDESRTLELFDLALRILSESGPIPPQLSDHFNSVLQQAKALAVEPRSVKGRLSPQAIQLACRIREVSELRDAVERIDGIDSVSPDLASKILTSLEERVAP